MSKSCCDNLCPCSCRSNKISPSSNDNPSNPDIYHQQALKAFEDRKAREAEILRNKANADADVKKVSDDSSKPAKSNISQPAGASDIENDNMLAGLQSPNNSRRQKPISPKVLRDQANPISTQNGQSVLTTAQDLFMAQVIKIAQGAAFAPAALAVASALPAQIVDKPQFMATTNTTTEHQTPLSVALATPAAGSESVALLSLNHISPAVTLDTSRAPTLQVGSVISSARNLSLTPTPASVTSQGTPSPTVGLLFSASGSSSVNANGSPNIVGVEVISHDNKQEAFDFNIKAVSLSLQKNTALTPISRHPNRVALAIRVMPSQSSDIPTTPQRDHSPPSGKQKIH